MNLGAMNAPSSDTNHLAASVDRRRPSRFLTWVAFEAVSRQHVRLGVSYSVATVGEVVARILRREV